MDWLTSVGIHSVYDAATYHLYSMLQLMLGVLLPPIHFWPTFRLNYISSDVVPKDFCATWVSISVTVCDRYKVLRLLRLESGQLGSRAAEITISSYGCNKPRCVEDEL